jgi:hypothetical protein
MRQHLAARAEVPGVPARRHLLPHGLAPIQRRPPQCDANVIDARKLIIVKVLDQISILR